MTDSNGQERDSNPWNALPYGQIHECALCGLPGSATHMFNLACDPRQTSDEALKQLIRCKRCAENIAHENGKLLNERGCGVFPLSVTMQSRNRSETDPVPAGVTTYACSVPGCCVRRPSDQMYNLRMGKDLTNSQAVLPEILCVEHATEIARAKGTEPCAPESGIFRLSYTLRLQRESVRHAASGIAVPLWRGKPR